MDLNFLAIIKPVVVLILYTLAGFLACRVFVTQKHLKFIKKVTFNLLLPSLVFSSMISGLTVAKIFSNLGLVFFQLFFCVLGYFIYRLFYKKKIESSDDRVKLGLIIFANAGYIPIALFSGMFSGEIRTELLNLVFLLLIGFNFIVFSYGEILFSKSGFNFKKLKNAPLIAIFISCALIVFGYSSLVPSFVIDVTATLGHLTIPFVMFALGGGMYFSNKEKVIIDRKDLLKMFIIKGFVLPVIGLSAALLIKNELLAFLVFIEFLVPPASNLVVLARNDNKQSCLISTYIYYTYLISVIYLPVWIWLYMLIK